MLEKLGSFFKRKSGDMLSANKGPKAKKLQTIDNQHIKSYLDYYLSLSYAPHYAVLISGPWGIGKTSLIESIISSEFSADQYSYVSLYGVENTEDIDAAIFQTLYPITDHRGVKFVGKIGKIVMKYARVDGVLKIKDFLTKSTGRIYIFDDFERSRLKPETVMGYINNFVEHDDCKVIVIANEEELLKDQKYVETREKIIGKTLEAQPEARSVTLFFIDNCKSDKAKKILSANIDSISRVFSEATPKNFRILQQTIWDFERIIECLPEKQTSNDLGIKELLTTFFALSIEAKAGNLSENDILERKNSHEIAMSRAFNKELTEKTASLAPRFSEADILSNVLSNKILADIIFKGIISKEEITSSLSQNIHFVDPASEPEWRTVWHGIEREDDVFNSALTAMIQKYNEHKYLKAAEIQHVVGIFLWLSKINVIDQSREEIISSAKQYADALYENGTIPKMPAMPSFHDEHLSYDGLGVHERETEDFKSFSNHLYTLMRRASEDEYPAKAIALMETMKINVVEFYSQISWGNHNNGLYAGIPIFTALDPTYFVDSVLSLSPPARRTAFSALSARYSHGALLNQLAMEKPWLAQIDEQFRNQATSLSKIQQYSLMIDVERCLSPLLKAA